jgi:UDP-N-acetylmuramyl pentapeptide phosphotransferase/UDP-N-acetylglucosamine-1-phosphate transferase
MRKENPVGCLLLVVFLAFPRIALALLFFFSNYLERAYHSLLFPLLGFLFLPLTTLVYAWMTNTRQPIAGIDLLILIVAVVIDLGGVGGGAYHRRRRWQD